MMKRLTVLVLVTMAMILAGLVFPAIASTGIQNYTRYIVRGYPEGFNPIGSIHDLIVGFKNNEIVTYNPFNGKAQRIISLSFLGLKPPVAFKRYGDFIVLSDNRTISIFRYSNHSIIHLGTFTMPALGYSILEDYDVLAWDTTTIYLLKYPSYVVDNTYPVREQVEKIVSDNIYSCYVGNKTLKELVDEILEEEGNKSVTVTPELVEANARIIGAGIVDNQLVYAVETKPIVMLDIKGGGTEKTVNVTCSIGLILSSNKILFMGRHVYTATYYNGKLVVVVEEAPGDKALWVNGVLSKLYLPAKTYSIEVLEDLVIVHARNMTQVYMETNNTSTLRLRLSLPGRIWVESLGNNTYAFMSPDNGVVVGELTPSTYNKEVLEVNDTPVGVTVFNKAVGYVFKHSVYIKPTKTAVVSITFTDAYGNTVYPYANITVISKQVNYTVENATPTTILVVPVPSRIMVVSPFYGINRTYDIVSETETSLTVSVGGVPGYVVGTSHSLFTVPYTYIAYEYVEKKSLGYQTIIKLVGGDDLVVAVGVLGDIAVFNGYGKLVFKTKVPLINPDAIVSSKYLVVYSSNGLIVYEPPSNSPIIGLSAKITGVNLNAREDVVTAFNEHEVYYIDLKKGFTRLLPVQVPGRIGYALYYGGYTYIYYTVNGSVYVLKTSPRDYSVRVSEKVGSGEIYGLCDGWYTAVVVSSNTSKIIVFSDNGIVEYTYSSPLKPVYIARLPVLAIPSTIVEGQSTGLLVALSGKEYKFFLLGGKIRLLRTAVLSQPRFNPLYYAEMKEYSTGNNTTYNTITVYDLAGKPRITIYGIPGVRDYALTYNTIYIATWRGDIVVLYNIRELGKYRLIVSSNVYPVQLQVAGLNLTLKTNASIVLPSPGTYKVRVTAKGYKPYEAEVNITEYNSVAVVKAQLEPLYYNVKIIVRDKYGLATGSTLLVDNKQYNYTKPLTLKLPYGYHRFYATSPFHKANSTRILVDHDTTIELVLERVKANLTITVTPEVNATITVDQTTYTGYRLVLPVDPGEHTIKVTAEGYSPVEKKINVSMPGAVVKVELAPIGAGGNKSTLTVTVTGGSCQLKIDGRDYGVVKGVKTILVDRGKHTVECNGIVKHVYCYAGTCSVEFKVTSLPLPIPLTWLTGIIVVGAVAGATIGAVLWKKKKTRRELRALEEE